MKRRTFVLSSIAALVNTGMTAPEAVAGSSAEYMLGDTKVTLNLLSSGSGHTYFAPHSNETTGLAAAKAVVRKYGGQLYWLSHGDGLRNISFVLGGKTYAVDPNRMFSDKGAKASLKAQGAKNFSPEALKAVRSLAEGVARTILSNPGLVVGVHNNSDGPPLSTDSYQKGGAYAKDARAVYPNPALDKDDFFFVTKDYLFDRLKAKGFNVVLQASPIGDDGSFSVRCQRLSNTPYVNVEAQAGHSTQQKKMFEALAQL